MDTKMDYYSEYPLLVRALKKRKTREFNQRIFAIANIIVKREIHQNYLNIFEIALQRPFNSEFIEICLACGYNPNELNPIFMKKPINFAVESFDFMNCTKPLEDK